MLNELAQPQELQVAPEEAGWRLDVFLTHHFPSYSRALIRKIIGADGVRVDGQRPKVSYRLVPGQRVNVRLPELPRSAPRPEAIPLSILYEDDWLLAVDKPPGMVVHPARGHWSGTLASAVAHHVERLSSVGGPQRPGIVHRLDRDTSGVIVIAKQDLAHHHLARQFAERTVEKEYFALTAGVPDRDADYIQAAIGVHPAHREKMAIRPESPHSKAAESYYEVVERFRGFAAVRILPKTGRTHQIRVHLASIGAAVLCDRQYGGRAQLLRGEVAGDPADAEPLLQRQALHARRLEIDHPASGERLTFAAPLPADIQTTLDLLRAVRSL